MCFGKFKRPSAADSFLRSRSVIVLSRFYSAGQAEIWLDNNEDKAVKSDSNCLSDWYDTVATLKSKPRLPHDHDMDLTRDGVFMVS